MVKKIFIYSFIIPVSIFIVIIGLDNRQEVSLIFNPLGFAEPFYIISAPLFIFFTAFFILGLLIGYILCYIKSNMRKKITIKKQNDHINYHHQFYDTNEEKIVKSLNLKNIKNTKH